MSKSNINAIIDILQAHNPNVTIIIEKMAPGDAATMTQFGTTHSASIAEMDNVAQQQTTSSSDVIVVDMVTGFDAIQFLADEVHYNQAGAIFIASRYYQVLQGVL